MTGGAGYTGLKLSQRLIEARHEVTVFDNFMYMATSLASFSSSTRLCASFTALF